MRAHGPSVTASRTRTLGVGRASIAAMLLALWSVPVGAQSGPDVARAWREAHEAQIVREFAELLALPNNASDTENIRANAARIREAP